MSQAGQFSSLSGDISTLTGDTGGAVSPNLGNINIVGGTGITVNGDDPTATLTIEASASTPTTFTADSGSASPALNNLDVLGGANITTSGAGDAITIAVSGTTNHAVQVGNASGSLTSIAVGTTGQVLVASTGGDPAFSAIGNNSGLTNHGVLLGQNNAAFVATAAGTNGQILIAATSADPAFASLTSTGSTISFTPGANTLNLETGTAVATSFVSDAGTATPASGALNVSGGSNINTAGATDTLTINLDSAITVTSLATDVAAAGLTVSGTTIAADGTDTDISLTLTPKGTGTVNITGRTQYAIANYGASGALGEIGPLTNGQMIIGSTGTDSVAGTITSTGGSLTVTPGAGTLDISIAAPVSVANGGTGATSLTDHGVLIGSGTGAVTAASVGTDGQVLLGASGADPAFATLTSSGGTITFTPGANSLNLEASVTSFTWSEVTGTTQAMAVQNGYILNNAGLVTATLPSTATVGDVMEIVGKGAGGWRLAQNAGQTVYIGNTNTTTGATGRLDSTDPGDCIRLVCITANNDFRVTNMVGNITVT